jgi:hypothetical protein
MACTVCQPISLFKPQVAERSLFLWNHEYIITLVAQYRQAVLPIVFGALEENANNHWNPAVHGLTCNVRKMFMVSAAWQFFGLVSCSEGCCWAAVTVAAAQCWGCTASPATCARCSW